MKKLFVLLFLPAGMARAGGPGGTPFHNELLLSYELFVLLVLLVVGTDYLVKFIGRKLKERKERLLHADDLAHDHREA